MIKKDILQEIPDEKLPELKKLYKNNWPYTNYVYYFVETAIQIRQKYPKGGYVKIYCPNGDFSDGTILAILEMNCYDVFMFTLDKKSRRLEQALRETKLINWTKKPLLTAIHEDFHEIAYKVPAENGHPYPNNIYSYVWWLPKERALQYNYKLPDDIEITQLTEKHVTTINSLWPHRSAGSEKFIAKLIEVNGGIGLVSKKTGELCAWVLKNYFGGFGVLQVSDHHKRKGYGSLIIKIFAKKIAQEDGYDITAFILRENIASQNMFTKLGFKEIVPITGLKLRKKSIPY